MTKAIRHLLTILLLMATNCMYAQQYVNLRASSAKKRLAKNAAESKYCTIIKETDSTMAFLIRDPEVQNLDILLHFDTSGKCDYEQTLLSCDSCYQKYVTSTLTNKYFRWTKIDSSTYFARYPYRLILTTRFENLPSFRVRRSDLKGREYRNLIKKALTTR